MPSEVAEQKQRLRARWRGEYPRDAESRKRVSAEVCALIRAHETFRKAKRIALFAPREWELDLLELWDPERVCFPKVLADGRMEFYRVRDLTELTPGFGGILEPPCDTFRWVIDWRPGDIILVPGLAFSEAGGRVGSGAGYYDRFLKTTAARPWGVGWEAQVVSGPIPFGPFDVPLWALCTEKGWRRCAPPADRT